MADPRLNTRTARVDCEQQLADRRSTHQALVRAAISQGPTDQRRAMVDAHLHRHAMLRGAVRGLRREPETLRRHYRLREPEDAYHPPTDDESARPDAVRASTAGHE
ncbi:hypothetical protein [Kitasatospora purpeofusca]|uniref:hypothetical protein n=1 Tax=Kitasatospora purpeofusca TaxID=67352 RepID=UPI0036D3BC59